MPSDLARHRQRTPALEPAAQEFAAAGLLALREPRAHGKQRRSPRLGSGKPQDERPRDAHERHGRGSRVPRQADERHLSACRPDVAERQRPARLDGNPPERQPALRHYRGLHVVFVADRHAARAHEKIVAGHGFGEGGLHVVGVVAQDAEIGHRAAETRQKSGQHVPVGVVDGAFRQRSTGGAHFIAGREQRHGKRRMDGKRGPADRRREAQIFRAQAAPGPEQRRTGGDVLAGTPQVGAARDAGRQRDPGSVARAILLHEDRVGPAVAVTPRNRCAGEHAHCGAAPRDAGQRSAGGRPSDDREGCRAIRNEIVEIHGVTVDR